MLLLSIFNIVVFCASVLRRDFSIFLLKLTSGSALSILILNYNSQFNCGVIFLSNIEVPCYYSLTLIFMSFVCNELSHIILLSLYTICLIKLSLIIYKLINIILCISNITHKLYMINSIILNIINSINTRNKHLNLLKKSLYLLNILLKAKNFYNRILTFTLTIMLGLSWIFPVLVEQNKIKFISLIRSYTYLIIFSACLFFTLGLYFIIIEFNIIMCSSFLLFNISVFSIVFINFIYKNFHKTHPLLYKILMSIFIITSIISFIILITFIFHRLSLILKKLIGNFLNMESSNHNNGGDHNNGHHNNGNDNNRNNGGNGNNNNGNNQNNNYDQSDSRSKGKGILYGNYGDPVNKSEEENSDNNDSDSNSSYSVYSSINGEETPDILQKKISIKEMENKLQRKPSFLQEQEDLRIARLRSLNPKFDHKVDQEPITASSSNNSDSKNEIFEPYNFEQMSIHGHRKQPYNKVNQSKFYANKTYHIVGECGSSTLRVKKHLYYQSILLRKDMNYVKRLKWYYVLEEGQGLTKLEALTRQTKQFNGIHGPDADLKTALSATNPKDPLYLESLSIRHKFARNYFHGGIKRYKDFHGDCDLSSGSNMDTD